MFILGRSCTTASRSIGFQRRQRIDNAGMVQFFGARNRRMATELSALVGGVDAEAVMQMAPDEQMLLVDGVQTTCKQVRHYADVAFSGR
jgi:hypothetical protein